MRARRSVFGRLATGIVSVILAGCGSRSAAIPNSQAHQAWAADLAVRGESGSTAGYKPAIAPAWIGGELYRMTLKGAAHDYGSVYGVTSTGKAFPLSSFSVHSIMEQPVTSLNGVLYGSVTFSYADKNGSGSTNAFTVTAVKAGKCNILISGGFGTTVTVPVTVH